MRFFIIACVFCGLIASVGCMTNNWSSPIFQRQNQIKGLQIEQAEQDKEKAKPKPNFWNAKFGSSAGIDPRARAIEERLGL